MTPITREWLGTLNALAGTINLGAAAAACRLAGLTPGSMDVLGALNIKAGNGQSPAGWRDLEAVCNQLAGTNNLGALLALQLYLAAGGGGGLDDMKLLGSVVLSAAQASITFASIEQDLSVVRLLAVGRSATAASGDQWTVQLNGDTGAHYDSLFNESAANGTNAASYVAAQTLWKGGTYLDLAAASATAGVPGYLELEIPAYAGTALQKIGKWRSGYLDGPNTTGSELFSTVAFRSTSAINQIVVAALSGAKLVAGTAAFLYGY